jgi:hypothetical protein
MKKFIILLLFCLTFGSSFSQTRVTATSTEMYTYDTNKSEWILYSRNPNVEIEVILEDDFITFFAKTPTMFRLDKNNPKEVKLKSGKGYRYNGWDFRRNQECLIDVIQLKSGEYLISIIPSDFTYNLRYYISE